MPELPEVETVRRGLSERIVGKVVAGESHDTDKGFPNAPEAVAAFMISAKVMAVKRRAKVLLIELSSHYTLMVHLKMTGQLVVISSGDRFGAGHPSDSLVGALPDSSTRVTISFADGTKLFFNDQRKFGWMKLLPTADVAHEPFMQKVGPEPLEDSFTPQIFTKRLARRPKTSIKAALLDQTVLAGVGNIYADEGLWAAKIHPQRLVQTLKEDEITALYAELRAIMNLAIEKGGSSNHTYVNAGGEKGKYMDFANAYQKTGLPCARCDTPMEKLKVAGRGTHICPRCQVVQ